MEIGKNKPFPYTVDELLDKAADCIEKYELELACKFFEKALFLEPENTNVLDEFAQLLLEIGKSERATNISFFISFSFQFLDYL